MFFTGLRLEDETNILKCQTSFLGVQDTVFSTLAYAHKKAWYLKNGNNIKFKIDAFKLWLLLLLWLFMPFIRIKILFEVLTERKRRRSLKKSQK